MRNLLLQVKQKIKTIKLLGDIRTKKIFKNKKIFKIVLYILVSFLALCGLIAIIFVTWGAISYYSHPKTKIQEPSPMVHTNSTSFSAISTMKIAEICEQSDPFSDDGKLYVYTYNLSFDCPSNWYRPDTKNYAAGFCGVYQQNECEHVRVNYELKNPNIDLQTTLSKIIDYSDPHGTIFYPTNDIPDNLKKLDAILTKNMNTRLVEVNIPVDSEHYVKMIFEPVEDDDFLNKILSTIQFKPQKHEKVESSLCEKPVVDKQLNITYSLPHGWVLNRGVYISDFLYLESCHKISVYTAEKDGYKLTIEPNKPFPTGRAFCEWDTVINNKSLSDLATTTITREKPDLSVYIKGYGTTLSICSNFVDKNGFDFRTDTFEITYNLPPFWDDSILKEMDSIVESIRIAP